MAFSGDAQDYSVNPEEYSTNTDGWGSFDSNGFREVPSSGIPGSILKGIGLNPEQYNENLRTYLDRRYEQANLAAARNWDLYMQSTQYQRSVEDLKKAGLNPWLAAQGSLGSGAGGSSTDVKSTSSKQASNKNGLTGLAALFVAFAKLLA